MWPIGNLLSVDRGVQAGVDGKLKAVHSFLNALRSECLPKFLEELVSDICDGGWDIRRIQVD